VIGSAFFIAVNGVLLTAKHVVFEKDHTPCEDLSILHFLPNGKILRRLVGRILAYNGTDLAFLFLSDVRDAQEALVTNPVVPITEALPDIDEPLCTFGYPKSDNYTEVKNGTPKINLHLLFTEGRVVNYQENGTGILKHPCIQTSMHLDHGHSGGPVFNQQGGICAVNSTSFDVSGEEEPISFITPIAPIFDFSFEIDGGEITSIRQLTQEKKILLI
jgi:hypothetical protein